MMKRQQNGRTNKENQVIRQLQIREQELLKQLRMNESLNAKILDILPFTVFLEDPEGRVIFINKHAAARFGISLEDLIGKSKWEFFPPAIAEGFRQYDLEVWRTKELITKEELIEYKGSKSYVFTGKTIIQSEEEPGDEFLLGFSIDITSRVKAEQLLRESAERIKHMAYHDSLTDLPNRRFIMQWSEDLLTISNSKQEKLTHAVMLIDLDHFKVINDSLGHQVGDQLLQAVALRLKSCIGADNFIARLGGDEFILFVPELESAENVQAVSEAIMRIMEEPFHLQNHMVTVSTSIGISIFPNDGRDIHTLLKHADIALYQSKKKGRNGYQLFQTTMLESANSRMKTETLLRHALENNTLFVQYQPKINLVNGCVTGFEALARCRDEHGQTIVPDVFIPIAEETGLIVPIDEWILREACLACRRWNESGNAALSVSVNLSARQFQSRDLEQRISRILQETGLEPHLLELELTESTVMHNPNEAAHILSNLKKLGVCVSIDDFGTGFSSLNYLALFPIDTLKIDRSFIRQTPSDPARGAISSAIISLAKNLKLNVVAEGVETQEQLDFLRDHQCDAVQGYYFSRPIDEEQVLDFLAAFRYPVNRS